MSATYGTFDGQSMFVLKEFSALDMMILIPLKEPLVDLCIMRLRTHEVRLPFFGFTLPSSVNTYFLS